MTPALAHAWRAWTRSPGVTLLAVLAFAIGLGSATAIFTVVSGVMLRPLPYADGDRYTILFGARLDEPGRFQTMSVADAAEYRQRTTSFDVYGWFRTGNFTIVAGGEPQFLPGAQATPELVRGLGVAPMLGRWFDDENAVVLSYALWRRLGADPDIVGTAITLNDRRVTVSGVMPVHFKFPIALLAERPSEVWTALPPPAADDRARQGVHVVYARRKPGVSFEQAEADVKRVAAQIVENDPGSRANYTGALLELRQDAFGVFGPLRKVLLTLLAAAGVLVLIACANVATLLLARAVARARETAIHVALGVSRRQLALRYFLEAGGLSLAGAAAGMALSVVLVRAIVTAGPGFLPGTDDLPVDWRVLLFGSGIAGLASVLASLAPLWQATRIAPNAVLTSGVRASAGAGVRRLSHGLVVVEIGLAFALLTVASILIAHLQGLGRVSPGFDPDDLLTLDVRLPPGIAQTAAHAPHARRVIEAIRALPDVTAAAFSIQLPLDGCCVGGTLLAEGAPAADTGSVGYMFSTPGYLDTMRIPLRAGRFLNEADLAIDSDDDNAVLPVVINETAGRRYWAGRDPVGAFGRLNQSGTRFQVVGVAADVLNAGLNSGAMPEVYIPWTVFNFNPLAIAIRSPSPPERLVPAVRRAIREIDPRLGVLDVRPMTDVVYDSLQLERITSLVMVFFAIAAVVMATLGIYGVVAYAVRQRTMEMGTRMALGAVSRNLVALIVGGGLKMTASGIGLGAVALVGAVWLLGQTLGVREIGWLPYLSSTVLVGLVTTAASYAPAWRASLLSPMVALRDERTSALGAAAGHVRRSLSQVREAVLTRADESPVSSALLADFVTAARGASSHAEALHDVLAIVCSKMGVPSAMLLERRGDGFFPLVTLGVFQAAAQPLAGDGFLAHRLAAYPQPLPFVPGELEALASWAADHRPERHAEIRWLATTAVRLAAPLRTRTETTGMLLLGPPGARDTYGPAEKQMLRICADQFALMIENGHLTDRMVEQETVRRDLALAAEVQKRLLPAEPPEGPFADFEAVTLPARRIGGDYYDFVDIGEHAVGVAIADVSGKGIAAALIMAVVQASLRIVTSDRGIGPAALAARLNDFLYRSTPASKYATFFYAEVESHSRQLRYVNAGHNPPYLFRSARVESAGAAPALRQTGGTGTGAGVVDANVAGAPAVAIEELSTGGMVVGMFPGAEYEEGVVALHPGDVFVAFTDGVPEAHNPQAEEFGEQRLKDVVLAVVDRPAAEISARISAALTDWIQDAEQYDDLTFVVMKVT